MTTATALLLAGWGTDPRRLEPLRERLTARGVDARVWPYHPTGPVEHLGELLAHRIERCPDGGVHLVGHSLGGLVVAQAAVLAPTRLRTVTTINTPWRGTWAAYTGAGDLAESLRWRSAGLRGLRDRLQAHHGEPAGPRWLLLSALGDLATPASTALRSGGRGPRLERRLVPATGHSISLLSPRVVETVVDHVAPSRLAAAS